MALAADPIVRRERTRRSVCHCCSSPRGNGRVSFNRTAPMAVGLSADGASSTAAHWPMSHERLLRPTTTKGSAKSFVVATRPADGHLTNSYSVHCIRPHGTAQQVGKRSRNGGARDIEFRISSSTEAEGCGARRAAAAGTEPTVAAGTLKSERSSTVPAH